jgi:hypothetical protein
MQVGTLFARVIPQARNRGFMLVAGFDAAVNQKTMVRYITLASVTQAAIDRAFQEISKMLGAESVENVTRPDVQKRLDKIIERQQTVSRWAY